MKTYTRRMRVADKPGALRNLAILFAHSGDSWFWLLGLVLLGWFGSPSLARALCLDAGWDCVHRARLSSRSSSRYADAARKGNGEASTAAPTRIPFHPGMPRAPIMLAVLGLGLGPAWFGVVLLVWAPLVVLARVAMGVHYLSDVLAGALLGLVIGLAVLDHLGSRPLLF